MWGALQNAAKMASAAVENSDQLLGNLTSQATKLLENLDREYQSEKDESESNEDNANEVDQSFGQRSEEAVQAAVTTDYKPANKNVTLSVKKFDDAWDDIDNLLEEHDSEYTVPDAKAVPFEEGDFKASNEVFGAGNDSNLSEQTRPSPLQQEKLIKEMTDRVQELTLSNSTLKASLLESTSMAEQLQYDLVNCQNETSRLSTTISENEKKFLALSTSQSALISNLQSEIKTCLETNTLLQRNIDASSMEISELQNALNLKDEEIKKLSVQIQDFAESKRREDRVSSLRGKIDEVKALRDELKVEVSDSLHHMTLEMSDSIKLVADIISKSSNRTPASSTEEISKLRSELENARKSEEMKSERFQLQIDEMTATIESQTQKSTHQNSHIVELSAQILSLEKVIDELSSDRKSADELLFEVSNLKEELCQKEEEAKYLAETEKQLLSKIESLKSDIISLSTLKEKDEVEFLKLQNENVLLKDQLSSIGHNSIDVLRLQEENRVLESNLKNTEAKLNAVILELDECRQKISNLNEAKDDDLDKTIKLDVYFEEMLSYESVSDFFRGYLALLEKSNASFMGDIKDAWKKKLSQIIDLENLDINTQSEITNLKTQLKDLEADSLKNKTENDAHILQLNSQISELHELLRKSTQEKEVSKIETQKILEESALKINSLESLIEDLTNKIDTLESSREDSETIEQLKLSLTIEKEKYDEIVNQNDELLIKISDITMEKESGDLDIERLQSDIAKLTSQIEISESRFVALNDSLMKTNDEMSALTHQYQNAVKEVSDLKAREKQSQLDVESTVSKFKDTISKLSANIEDLERQNEVLNGTVVALKQREDSISQDKLSSEKEINQLLTTIEDMRKENESKSKQYEALTTTLSEAKLKLVEMTQKYEKSEARYLDKTIENASLHETIESITLKLKSKDTELVETSRKLIELETSYSSQSTNQSQQLSELKSQVETLLEEINFKSNALSNETNKYTTLSKEILELQEANKSLFASKELLAARVDELLAYKERAEKAEESLSKQDEKKKRDLENLRKLNEQLTLIKREKHDIEQETTAKINELESKVQTLQFDLIQLENVKIELSATQNQLVSTLDEIEKLKNPTASKQLGRYVSDGEGSSFEIVDINQSSNSSNVESGFELSPAGSADEDHNSLSKQFKERLVGLEQEKYLLLEEVKELKEKALSLQQQLDKLSSSEIMKDAEIKVLQTKLSQSEIKISRLDEERARLERDVHYYETSHNTDQSASAGKQRIRLERTSSDQGDIESGAELFNGYDTSDEDIDKKGEAGVHPALVVLWDALSRYLPFLLPFIGDKPPRLTFFGQILVLYFLAVQSFAVYKVYSPCQQA